jgi:aldehyde dehydrogenase (NAD+)
MHYESTCKNYEQAASRYAPQKTGAIAPAFLVGCTLVLKPAPEASLEALLLECAQTIGLPPSVLNVVPAGRETGDYLIRHRGVDKIGLHRQRVGLELGGQSAAVFLERSRFESCLPECCPGLDVLF